MSVSIKFESNIDRVMKKIRRKGLEVADKLLVERVNKVVCPVHGTRATSITKVSGGSESHRFRIDGCCEELTAAISSALRSE